MHEEKSKEVEGLHAQLARFGEMPHEIEQLKKQLEQEKKKAEDASEQELFKRMALAIQLQDKSGQLDSLKTQFSKTSETIEELKNHILGATDHDEPRRSRSKRDRSPSPPKRRKFTIQKKPSRSRSPCRDHRTAKVHIHTVV
jgi:hypothetical protein